MGPAGLEYLVSCDRYAIVLESMTHYIGRLKAIGDDQTVDLGMFGIAIRQAAIKRYPVARKAQQSVIDFLAGGAVPSIDDLHTMRNALECYEADIRQAATGSSSHVGLIKDATLSKARAVKETRALVCMVD